MTVHQLAGTSSVLHAKGWAHPRPGLSIDELVGIMENLGNTVLEIHRDCACIGAGSNTCDDGPDRDDHLLVIDKEVTR